MGWQSLTWLSSWTTMLLSTLKFSQICRSPSNVLEDTLHRLLWHFYINWRESGTFIVLDFFIIFFSYGFRDSLRSISSISCCLLYRPWSFKKIFLDILIFWLLWMKLFSSMKFSVNPFLESYWLLFIYFISRHFNEHSYFFLIIFWLVLAFRSLRWYPGD